MNKVWLRDMQARHARGDLTPPAWRPTPPAPRPDHRWQSAVILALIVLDAGAIWLLALVIAG